MRLFHRHGRSMGTLVFAGAAFLVGTSGCGVGLEGLSSDDDGGPQLSTNPIVARDAGGSSPRRAFEGGGPAGHDASSVAADSGVASDSGNEVGPADEGGAGAAGDGAVACSGATPSPCVASDTGNSGFCANGGRCSACTDVTDDIQCTTAYAGKSNMASSGAGVSGSYLCLAGACVPGECRTNSDCATSARGTVCGATTPNVCGRCTADSQCANAGPTTPVCDTTTGQCAAGACTPNAGNPPAICPVNPADVCCAGACQGGRGANACCPGPAASAYCVRLLGNASAACVGGLCTACLPVTGTTYSVDPFQGSDVAGTGDSSMAGCAFKTITRALQVIGKTPAAVTTISVLGPSTVGPGETFPIVVPANVNITAASGPVTVNVAALRVGFTLAGAKSGVVGGPGALLTISGQSATATSAIVASTGSQATTHVSSVTVTGFLDDGIRVDGSGTLSIGPGVTSTANGVVALRKSGLRVSSSGHAIIDVPLGSAPAHFDANTNYGILVEGSGYVTLTGVATTTAAVAGTITTSANYYAGLKVAQTSGTTPPQNVITGLVSAGSKNGNGLLILTGSNVKLRRSLFLSNHVGGVYVSVGSATTDISMIDLGNSVGSDYGNNTFGDPAGSAGNGSAAICLNVPSDTGILLAAGNVFGTVNCAASPGMLTIGQDTCSSSACAGGPCALGVYGSGNDIDVTMCTHP